MPTVETARGPIDTSKLGRVLMHEHVFITTPEMQQNYPEQWGDEEARVADAVHRLGELKANGMDTIVDCTAIGLGRYLPRIKRVAEQVGLNIVCATGLYVFDELPHYFGGRPIVDGVDPMTEMFVGDLTKGVSSTGIKAGIIKCATDEPGLTPAVERILRACAQAHRQTGAPITTHTHAASRRGLDQQKVFESEGVDLSRVVIGHCGDSEDIGYLEEVMSKGSFIGMDRFGIDTILTMDRRVRVVADLCKRGYASQMVLSHDTMCYIDWIPGEIPPDTMPHWHYLHITNDVIPALLKQGVTEDQVNTMLVDNPRRLFEKGSAY